MYNTKETNERRRGGNMLEWLDSNTGKRLGRADLHSKTKKPPQRNIPTKTKKNKPKKKQTKKWEKVQKEKERKRMATKDKLE